MAPKKSAKARKRDRRKNNNYTSESSEPSSALTTPRTSIASTTSTISNPIEMQKYIPNRKRQLDTINGHHLEADGPTSRTKIRPKPGLAYHKRWICSIWPCRLYRWLSLAIPVFLRSLWRTTYENKIFLLILIIGVYFAFWSAVEGILHIFRGVAAQQTLDASCSAVYVTIPGPIITVSLIGAKPTGSAKGEYSYSVTNGTRQWLYSTAPPISLYSFSPSTTASVQSPAAPPLVLTSVITGQLGEPISTLTLTSRSNIPPPMGPSRPFPIPPTVSEITTDFSILPSTPSFSTLTLPGASFTAPEFQTGSTSSPKMTSTMVFTSLISGELSRITSVAVSDLIPPPQPGFPSSPLPSTTSTLSQPGQSIGTMLSPPPMNSLTRTANPVASFTESLVLSTIRSDSLASASISRMPSGTPSALPDQSTSASVTSSAATVPSISGSDIITMETLTSQHSASVRTSRLTVSITPDPSLPSLGSSTRIFSSSGGVFPGRRSSSDSLPSISASKGVSSISMSLPFLSTLPSSRSSNTVPWSSRSPSPSSELNIWSSSNTAPMPDTSIMNHPNPTSLPGSSDLPVDISSWRSLVTLSSTGPPSSTNPTGTSGSPTMSRSTSTLTGGVTASSPFMSFSSGLISVPSSSSSFTSSPISTPLTTGSSTPPLQRTSSRALSTTTASSSSSFSFVTNSPFKTVSSSTLSSGSPLESSLLWSSPQSPITTRTTTSRAPMISSPGWNRTTISSPMCTGSVTGSGCESLKLVSSDERVTRILAYSNTEYTFAFPSPAITTTVSYWTGIYPSITGPEPSPILSTTRTLRQTPLSALPSIQLFARAESIPTTLVTTTVSASVVRAADIMDAAEPTTCGEYGNFTLGFDDSTIGPEDNNILPVVAVKNPYHHLFYSNGVAYVPDNWEPYPAISQPNVAMFLPVSGLLPNSPFAGTLLPGELGAGPRASVNAYWFNAYSGFFGCALNGITRCTLQITGYRYDAALKGEVVAAEQNVTIPACYGYINCRLVEVVFTEDFRGLSGIQFQAYTYNLGVPQIYMMDDLHMEWYNNTCGAGILRIGHR